MIMGNDDPDADIQRGRADVAVSGFEAQCGRRCRTAAAVGEQAP